MNAHPISNALANTSIGSFRAAGHKVHDAVMAEFGGSFVDENAETEGSGEGVETGMLAGTTEDGMELHEFYPRPQHAELADTIGESSSYLIGTT